MTSDSDPNLVDRTGPVLELDDEDLRPYPPAGSAADQALVAHTEAAKRYAAHQALRASKLLRKLFGGTVTQAMFEEDAGQMYLIAIYGENHQLIWYERDSALLGSMLVRDRDNVEAYGGPALPHVDVLTRAAIGDLFASAEHADGEWLGVDYNLLLNEKRLNGEVVATRYFPGSVFYTNIPGAVEEAEQAVGSTPLTKPLTRRQVAQRAIEGWLTVVVAVDYGELIAGGVDGANDLLSKAAVGDPTALADIEHSPVGLADNGETLLVEVAGDVSAWLAGDDSDDDEMTTATTAQAYPEPAAT
ncbi:hypothetical protein [Micromonospora arborensis]|uniref:hypothetical protein n=1 Tax=Micromonospora arborensis TaxID=2116518 RepID=UPI0037242876